jgi:valyl-tRNA synthetase
MEPVTYGLQNPTELWLIYKLNDLVASVTSSMERFAFDEALKNIRSFVWRALADHYIEAVKGRLYERDAYSQAALLLALDTIARLLAPFCPFFADEIFSRLHPGAESVHLHSWPEFELKTRDISARQLKRPHAVTQSIKIAASRAEVEEALRVGSLVKEIISGVRKYKSEQKLALNSRIEGVSVYTQCDMEYGAHDINNTLNADVTYLRGKPEIDERVTAIHPDLGSLGPRFKSKTKDLVELINKMPLEELSAQIERGSVIIDKCELSPADFNIKTERFAEGAAVTVIELSEGTILIKRS